MAVLEDVPQSVWDGRRHRAVGEGRRQNAELPLELVVQNKHRPRWRRGVCMDDDVVNHTWLQREHNGLVSNA